MDKQYEHTGFRVMNGQLIDTSKGRVISSINPNIWPSKVYLVVTNDNI